MPHVPSHFFYQKGSEQADLRPDHTGGNHRPRREPRAAWIAEAVLSGDRSQRTEAALVNQICDRADAEPASIETKTRLGVNGANRLA